MISHSTSSHSLSSHSESLPDALVAEKRNTWVSFTKAATVTTVSVVAVLALLAIFLL